MNTIKYCIVAVALAVGSLFTGAKAQEVTVVETLPPQIETVRWRGYYRPYYRPYVYRPYVRPYAARPYFAYRPYWSGYNSGYYYGPPRTYYYW